MRLRRARPDRRTPRGPELLCTSPGRGSCRGVPEPPFLRALPWEGRLLRVKEPPVAQGAPGAARARPAVVVTTVPHAWPRGHTVGGPGPGELVPVLQVYPQQVFRCVQALWRGRVGSVTGAKQTDTVRGRQQGLTEEEAAGAEACGAASGGSGSREGGHHGRGRCSR